MTFHQARYGRTAVGVLGLLLIASPGNAQSSAAAARPAPRSACST